MIYLVIGLFALIVGLVVWLVLSNRTAAAGRQKLKVEQAGREQRERFDEAGNDWDSGGGLGGRMFDRDPNAPGGSKEH